VPLPSLRAFARLGHGAWLLLAGCTTTRATSRAPDREPRWVLPTTVADSTRSERLAPGVWLHHLVRTTGPLRAHVLDIDLTSCVSLRALKGSPTAVGRITTSALLQQLPAADAPIAAVNADFFLFAPPGVPAGALVVDGDLLAGPIDRPVLAFDDRRTPYIGRLRAAGTVTSRRGRMPLVTWNRPSASALGVVDAAWGQALDSLSRPTALQLVPIPASGDRRYRVAALTPTHTGQARGDTLILVGQRRGATDALREGDTVRVEMGLSPLFPRTAVGGFPMLVRDSVIVPTVDSAGAASFRGVNPRTAVGYAQNGQRLLLVVIDGRQAGYSVGTTTRETAALLRDLGAREAVNLDGGGSTAMVVRDAASGAIRVVNKPSDAAGERPVGNALAVTGRCARTD
jgi:hypothetical protein